MRAARLLSCFSVPLLWVVSVAPALVCAQAAPIVDVARLDCGLRARELAAGVYVVEGANADFSIANGCNIINTGFIATGAGAGAIVINTGQLKRHGEQLRALIARTTDQPVLQVVNLNLHSDYFLDNQAFADVQRFATRRPVSRGWMQPSHVAQNKARR